jgi:hypothetical protein
MGQLYVVSQYTCKTQRFRSGKTHAKNSAAQRERERERVPTLLLLLMARRTTTSPSRC